MCSLEGFPFRKEHSLDNLVVNVDKLWNTRYCSFTKKFSLFSTWDYILSVGNLWVMKKHMQKIAPIPPTYLQLAYVFVCTCICGLKTHMHGLWIGCARKNPSSETNSVMCNLTSFTVRLLLKWELHLLFHKFVRTKRWYMQSTQHSPNKEEPAKPPYTSFSIGLSTKRWHMQSIQHSSNKQEPTK